MMKVSLCFSLLGFIANGLAAGLNIGTLHREDIRSQDATTPPKVPQYNVSLAIDHFNASDSRKFSNRYWVNDTYYRPGGPVFFFDFGEQGVSDNGAAQTLAGYQNFQNPVLLLAQRFNALVIGWENRYYGSSLPFPVNETTGVAFAGAPAYKYLTVEQALEDIAFFAKQFNKTVLGPGNTNVNSTANLGPSQTPWIFLATSYAGAKAAWARIRNPEVFFAAWASSAIVETRFDGSIYFNSIYRASPSNCTKDVQAIVAGVDQILTRGNTTDIVALKAAVYMATQLNLGSISDANQLTDFDVANYMLVAISCDYQIYGPAHTSQVFCDYLETFDVAAFKENQTASQSLLHSTAAIFYNPGNAKPNTNGVVASNGVDGVKLGLAAYAYATYKSSLSLANFASNLLPWYYTDAVGAGPTSLQSWNWQNIAETGYFNGTNVTSPFNLGSKFASPAAEEAYYEAVSFPNFEASDFPQRPNTAPTLRFGGWNMKPTNVMFTGGEIDAWSAFTVFSREQVDAAAPLRQATQTIPACSVAPNGSDVFGMTYPGKVHATDFYAGLEYRWIPTGPGSPMQLGTDLFAKALKAWQPCFKPS